MCLHGEMIIALNFLTIILIKGCSNFLDGSLYPNVGGARPAYFDQYMSDVKKLIKTQKLGNEFNPSHWTFPIQQNQSPKKVRELKNDNNTSRKPLRYSIKIIDISIKITLEKVQMCHA